MPRRLVLDLDEDDWNTIQSELSRQQSLARKHPLPNGDSNVAGAILAECIRNLNEYRDLYDAEHPK